MFVELDREEAQRHLDEMKGTLGSVSNPNLQAHLIPMKILSSHYAHLR